GQPALAAHLPGAGGLRAGRPVLRAAEPAHRLALARRRRLSPGKGGTLMFPTQDEIAAWLPDLLGGLSISLQVTALSLAIGIPFGLVLALGVLAKSRFLKGLSLFLVEVGRGAPALVLLQFI